MEVYKIVQEVVNKTISKKKKCKKAKWFSEETLQTAKKKKKKKKWKIKGEREGYTQLNAEFQRIARRDKKVSLSEQCKEMDENNILQKTRDLLNKIGDTKEIYHANMGTMKDRNSRNLTEVE